MQSLLQQLIQSNSQLNHLSMRAQWWVKTQIVNKVKIAILVTILTLFVRLIASVVVYFIKYGQCKELKQPIEADEEEDIVINSNKNLRKSKSNASSRQKIKKLTSKKNQNLNKMSIFTFQKSKKYLSYFFMLNYNPLTLTKLLPLMSHVWVSDIWVSDIQQKLHFQDKKGFQNMFLLLVEYLPFLSDLLVFSIIEQHLKLKVNCIIITMGSTINFATTVLTCVLNPCWIPIFILLRLERHNIMKKFQLQQHQFILDLSASKILRNTAKLIFIAIVLIVGNFYSFDGVYHYYQHILFPTTFHPSSNLMWIFYGHVSAYMFDRYLVHYQVILFLMSMSIAFPLSALKVSVETKFVCLILFLTFFMPNQGSGFIRVVMIWVIGFVSYTENALKYKKQIDRKVFVVLGATALIGSSIFFCIYSALLSQYLSSHMVNIGHVFLFGCIPWTLIVIWATEITNIQKEQQLTLQKQESSKQQKPSILLQQSLKQKLQNVSMSFIDRIKSKFRRPTRKPSSLSQKSSQQSDKIEQQQNNNNHTD